MKDVDIEKINDYIHDTVKAYEEVAPNLKIPFGLMSNDELKEIFESMQRTIDEFYLLTELLKDEIGTKDILELTKNA